MESVVIAPGRLLIRTRGDALPADEDPVLDAFLAFVAAQMQRSPETITALTSADVAGLDELLTGVDYDLDEALDGDFDLP